MKSLRLGCVAVLLVMGAVCTAAAQDDARADQAQEPSAESPAPSGPATNTPPPATDTTQGKAGGRMFGVLPNYATVEGASTITPISPREKFKLAKMNSLDPFLYPFVGVVAVVERSYGPGAKAYAKQYGASFADNSLGNVMTTAIFPSLLRQDPRYFQRGRGSTISRLGYSASRLVITHGNSGRGQFNFSEVGGTLTAATLSNAYYPMSGRGASHTVSRWALQLMWDGLSNELKEFWPDVRRRLARPPKVPAS